MESMRGASRSTLFTKAINSARLWQNAAAVPSERVCSKLLLQDLSKG